MLQRIACDLVKAIEEVLNYMQLAVPLIHTSRSRSTLLEILGIDADQSALIRDQVQSHLSLPLGDHVVLDALNIMALTQAHHADRATNLTILTETVPERLSAHCCFGKGVLHSFQHATRTEDVTIMDNIYTMTVNCGGRKQKHPPPLSRVHHLVRTSLWLAWWRAGD
ncbi:hypothetical protein BJX62DRAFT_45542 [Aspergillus germanicus]